MTPVVQWLLLEDGSAESGPKEGRACRLVNGHFSLGVYGRRVEVIRLDGAPGLRASAEAGAGVGYRQLWRAGCLRRELSARFTVENIDVRVSGRSAELLFALALVGAVCGTGTVSAFAATGTLTESGDIGTVSGLGAKLDAAIRALGSGDVVFYPQENGAEVTDDLLNRARLASVRLIGVRHIAEAALEFGVDLPALEEPYRGLQPFEDRHRGLYFGRQSDIDQIGRQLRQREKAGKPGLLILAASGAGKTSLLQAGILPSLRLGPDALVDKPTCSQVWRVEQSSSEDEATLAEAVSASWSRLAGFDAVRNEPRVATLDELLARLPAAAVAGEVRFLWVVDQLEQIFRSRSVPTTHAFLAFLRELQRRGVWVIGALRADFYQDYLASPDLVAAFASNDAVPGVYGLAAPTAKALDQIILGPAEAAELRFEIDRATGVALSTQLREDVGKFTTALPQLQVTLQRLYEKRDPTRGMMLWEHYPGLERAIADAADEAIADLDAAARSALPALIMSLVDIRWKSSESAGPTDVREFTSRATDLSRWPPDSPIRRLTDRLLERRLLTGVESGASDRNSGRVKVVHESLLTWEAARAIIQDNLAALQLRSRLHDRAVLWDVSGRIADRLLSAKLDVEEAERLWSRHRELLDAPVDRQFVEQSMLADAAARERRTRMEVLEQTRIDARQRHRYLVGIVGLVIVIVSIVGFVRRFDLDRAWLWATATRPMTVAESLALTDGDTFNECRGALSCPRMVVVRAGSFAMGSPMDELGREDDEGPRHPVSVRRFALGEVDVTFDEWKACVDHTDPRRLQEQRDTGAPLVGCAPTTDSGFGAGRHPVINTSWEDAQGYIRWLNLMIGHDASHGPYRLPSEAEWEYAARAGSDTAYFWGDDSARQCDYANGMTRATKLKYPALLSPIEAAPTCEDPYTETSPVGAFKANRFGLFDMNGNVWQWTQDCYGPYSAGRSDGRPMQPEGDCPFRVLRGASWRQSSRTLRSAYRGKYPPGVRYFDVGFRVARDL